MTRRLQCPHCARWMTSSSLDMHLRFECPTLRPVTPAVMATLPSKAS